MNSDDLKLTVAWKARNFILFGAVSTEFFFLIIIIIFFFSFYFSVVVFKRNF